GQCLERTRVDVLHDKAERKNRELQPVGHQVQNRWRCAVVRHGRYVELSCVEEASHSELRAGTRTAVVPVENAPTLPDILYELRQRTDPNARMNNEDVRPPHGGADRHEALLAPAKVCV